MALAQTVERASLAACNALPTDAERLACFEALVDNDEAAPDSAAPPAATEPVSGDVEATVVEPDPGPADAPAEAAAPVEAAAAPAAAAGNEAVSATSVPASTDEDFGREHIEPRQPAEPEQLRATVINTERKRDKGVTFYLDNGQVWQQVDDRYFPYPKGETFDIVIDEGMMGDYRLRVGGEGRMIRVQRRQ